MKVAGAAGELGGLRQGPSFPSYKGKNTVERYLLRGVPGKPLPISTAEHKVKAQSSSIKKFDKADRQDRTTKQKTPAGADEILKI